MVPEIKNLKILEPTILEHPQDHFFGRAVFHEESAATFSFGKNRDFERLIPYTRSPISVPHFRRYLQPDSTQATQNFSIGVIFDAESDGIEIFWKLKTFTISRNKVRVQPFTVQPAEKKPVVFL